jgi:hypothetical protein
VQPGYVEGKRKSVRGSLVERKNWKLDKVFQLLERKRERISEKFQKT